MGPSDTCILQVFYMRCVLYTIALFPPATNHFSSVDSVLDYYLQLQFSSTSIGQHSLQDQNKTETCSCTLLDRSTGF